MFDPATGYALLAICWAIVFAGSLRLSAVTHSESRDDERSRRVHELNLFARDLRDGRVSRWEDRP